MYLRRAPVLVPRLRMPGAGNADVCLRLRCVPGCGKPGAMPRQHRLTYHHRAAAACRAAPCLLTRRCDSLSRAASSHRPTRARCRQHRCMPSSTTCPRAWHNASSPTHDYMAPCARGSSATSSTPATPTRHRPRHSSHGYLDYGFTTLRSRLLRQRHKGLPPAWEPRWLPLQPRTPRCVDRYDCGGDIRRLRLWILLQSHRLHRYVVTAGGC